MQIALEQLEALLSTLEEKKVAEFEYEDEKIRLRVALGRAQVTAAGGAGAPIAFAAAAAGPALAAGAGASGSDALEAGVAYVTSPFVGTFYRAPSPEAGNFVEVGSQVKPGQPLCIIEAMKLMNEIESEYAGSVLEILVENGKSVEFGQKLFKIKKA
jgi:acetyl-CoA carboxylase biotin carboxyl carrier protein